MNEEQCLTKDIKVFSCKVANAGRWSVLKELPVHSDGHKVMIRHSITPMLSPHMTNLQGLSLRIARG